MPSRRSGARAAARASHDIDGVLALLRSHPLTHSLHVVVPSSKKEKERKGLDGSGGGGDVAPAPPAPSQLFDLLPKPPPYLCVPALNLAELTTPQFVAWAFPDETGGGAGGKEGGGGGEEETPVACGGGACGLAAPASLDAGGGAALSPDGRLLVALPAEERARAGDPAPGASRRDPGGRGGWYLSEIFLTAGRRRKGARAARAAKAARAKAAAGEEEAMEAEQQQEEQGAAEAGAAASVPANEHRPLAKARERLAAATLPVPFALLPPSFAAAGSGSTSASPSSYYPLPPLPGAREVWPREHRRLGARAPLSTSLPDFARFFRRRTRRKKPGGKQRGGRGEQKEQQQEEEAMEVDEKEEAGEEAAAAVAAAAAAAGQEEEENSSNDDDDDGDDRERLSEALEWLGLTASLSSPSVTLVAAESEGEEEEEEAGSSSAVVDVCSFEGLLGSGFAARVLEAAAAAVAKGKDSLPWAALVLVGFPDSPLSWTAKGGSSPREARKEEAAATETATAKKTTTKKNSSSSSSPEPVRLGPEACREHALFVVVVRGGGGGEEGAGGGGCRFLAAVASGGGDGFDSRLL